MINIVMRPKKGEAIRNYEGVYLAEFNGENLLEVRARNAKHAEEKLMEVFRFNLKGKSQVDFNLEQWKEQNNGKTAAKPAAEAAEQGDAET